MSLFVLETRRHQRSNKTHHLTRVLEPDEWCNPDSAVKHAARVRLYTERANKRLNLFAPLSEEEAARYPLLVV